MKVKVISANINWLDIKNACRQTISLKSSEKEPSDEWKRKLLIARHSPLRLGQVLVQVDDIPFYVMGHLVRHHIGCTPFVSTSREDRTGVPRNERKQTDLVSMQFFLNIESILNISEKRLCTCADIETIKVWKEILLAIKEYDENIYWASVPSCVAHGGCIEQFGNCTYYEKLMQNSTKEEQTNLIKRYNLYNKKR